MADISVIIVNWNVRDLLGDCLASIYADTGSLNIEVIVVDNVSSDGSVEMVRSRYPQVIVVEPGENTGFSRGNNIGIARASSDYIFLLNPDTVLHNGCLAHLFEYMKSHQEVGVVVPLLMNADGSVQSSRRRFPTMVTAYFESTWLQPYAPRNILSWYYMEDHSTAHAHEIDWAQGAALMVRQATIDQAGMLDEQFFMYSEELDWQRRIKEAGWQIVFLPYAKVTHYGGKSSEQVKAQLHIYFQTSKIKYFRKYHGRTAAGLLRLFLMTSYRAQVAVESVKKLLGHKVEMRQERIDAYRKVLRSGLRG